MTFSTHFNRVKNKVKTVFSHLYCLTKEVKCYLGTKCYFTKVALRVTVILKFPTIIQHFKELLQHFDKAINQLNPLIKSDTASIPRFRLTRHVHVHVFYLDDFDNPIDTHNTTPSASSPVAEHNATTPLIPRNYNIVLSLDLVLQETTLSSKCPH